MPKKSASLWKVAIFAHDGIRGWEFHQMKVHASLSLSKCFLKSEMRMCES